MKLLSIQKDGFPQWQAMRSALYGSLNNERHQKEIEQAFASQDFFCYFLAGNGDRILGLVELASRNIVDGCSSSPVAYLEGLYLKEEYRGKGFGKEAIGIILQWCKEKGFSELATDAELTNLKAQKFYQALGFQEIDRVVEYRIDVR